MTRKVLDINVEGIRFVCILNPEAKSRYYRLYHRWYDGGWHRKEVAAYDNFASVLCWLKDYAMTNHWGFKDFFPQTDDSAGA